MRSPSRRFFRITCFCSLLFCLSADMGEAQNIPVVTRKDWKFGTGTTLSIPVIGTYHDFSLVKGSDYYWEYQADPLLSCFAPFFELDRLVNVEFKSNNIGFYSYGIALRESLTRLGYEGWEGGGNSGVFYEGKGYKSWRENELDLHVKVTHQFGLGRKNQPVLNSLGLASQFALYENYQKDFTGSFNNGPEYHYLLRENFVPNGWYVPQLKLNYEFAMVFHAGNYLLLPSIETSLLNLNNFLRFKFPDHEPLQKRPEYYKEITFGLSMMRSRMK